MNNYYNKDKLEVGIDEVGRGCLAGPVTAAAVIWPKDNIDNIPELVNWIDSKGIAKWDAEILTYPAKYHYSNYAGTINWPNALWSAQCVTKNLQANSALKQIYSNLSDQS